MIKFSNTHDNNIRQRSAHPRADENLASNTAPPTMLGKYTKSPATKRTPDYFASVVCADILNFIITHRRRDRGLSMHEIQASATSNTRALLLLLLQHLPQAHSSVTQTLSARWRHRFRRLPQVGDVLFTCDFSDVNRNLVLLIFPLCVIRSLSEQCRSSFTDYYTDMVERRHSVFSRFYANAKKTSDTSQLASSHVSGYVEQRTISLNKGLFSFIFISKSCGLQN